MPTYGAGAMQQLRLGKETNWGVAPAAGSGRLVRRKTCDIAPMREAYESGELRPDNQVSDMRLGLISNGGSLVCEPSPGSYSDLIGANLRRAFAVGATTGALTNVTATAGAPHFVRAAGSFLTDGFKLFDVIRWSGWATTGVPNNGRNYMITVLTATQMTVVDLGAATAAVGAKVSGDSVTCTVYGKKSFIPNASWTDDSFSIERYHADVTPLVSELFNGVKVGSSAWKLATGSMGEVAFALQGGGYTNAAAAYYTAPTPVSSTPVLAGANGGLLIAGGQIAYVRDLSFTIDNQLDPIKVAFTNNVAGIAQGVQKVTGSLTAMFPDATLRDYFLNETEVSLAFFLTTTSTPTTADFLHFVMPRVKFKSFSKPDSSGVITQQLQFQALYNGAGGAGISSEATTISIQDTLA